MLKPILPIMLLGLALSMPVEATRSYGPVKDQDTLWSIATQLRPDQGATVQQTMLALYYKNPQAFASNNINSLMKGAVLKAPNSAEARRYQRLGALREARKHNVYWTRGAQLPYTVPPPVPKIKERANPKRSKVVTVKASVSEASPSRSTARSTERRITRLQAQLQSVESKNQRLAAELQALQAKQTQSKPSPQLDAQVKKLKLELQELTSVLGQKDNHIKTLQASLKNASETIKSQHADNMRLYDKLKEVSPSSLPASPSSEGKSELKLTTVEASTAAVASKNQGSKDTPPKSVWADQQTTPNKQASTTPTKSTPTESASTKSTPTESASTESTPTESASTKSTPTESVSTKSTPTESTPTESVPSKVNNTSDPKALNSPEPQTNPPTAAPSATEASQASPESSTLAAAVPNTVTTAIPSISPTATASNTDDKATQPTAGKTGSEATDQGVDKNTDQDKSTSPEAVAASTASEIKAPSSAQAVAQLTPTNEVKTSGSVPVSQMLAQPHSVSTPAGDKVNSSSAPLRGVSPLALAIALISLLFILALVWRAFLQHREMRQLEQEEARMAERMRKRLEENQAAMATNLVERKETDLASNTEIKF